MRFLSVFTALLLCSPLWAQQIAVKPSQKGESSFAIISDLATYNACKSELNAYRSTVENDGLPTYLIADDWKNPEAVKEVILKLYNEDNLEGAVFVGNIPVAMIRGAQHFTSAFKMDQKEHPFFDSSVPSDRFYDDFDLKFRFLQQDSSHSHLFYYWLTGDSKQRISSDIYTGRIRSTKSGEEGFAQIRGYLQKVVKERTAVNPMDVLVSYTGEGSFSNSLNAWRDETVTLNEQIPEAFKRANNAKFFIFAMEPYMKETLHKELQRDDVDIMLFHEHGTTDRQYITGSPTTEDEEELIANAKMFLRNQIRRLKRYKSSNLEEFQAKTMKKYGIDSTWFSNVDDPKVIAADSLADLKTGIVLDDVKRWNPNPRFVIFDACYNGDYRDGDFIAGEYIYGSGKTIACWANSVNVLQDKSSSDLLGMLAYGMKIGDWAKNINILESHIIGDPTFHFTAPKEAEKINLRAKESSYWLQILEGNYPCDIQSLALYRLFEMEYPEMSNLLYKKYVESPYYTQRLQCMTLLAYYNDSNYINLLKLASDDPYEFIRRKAAYYMGKTGRNEFAPILVKMYMNDYLNERVAFNVLNTIDHLDIPLAESLFEDEIEKSKFIFNKEEFEDMIQKSLKYSANSHAETLKSIIGALSNNRYRKLYISSLRNNPIPSMVPDILWTLADAKTENDLRIQLAEALGWFTRAYNREQIISGCQSILASEKGIDPALADELTKTINRLKEYTR